MYWRFRQFLHVPDPVPVRDRNTTEMFLLQTGSRHLGLLILSAPVPEPVPARMQAIYLAAGSSPVPDPVPVRMQVIYLAAGSSPVPDPVPAKANDHGFDYSFFR